MSEPKRRFDWFGFIIGLISLYAGYLVLMVSIEQFINHCRYFRCICYFERGLSTVVRITDDQVFRSSQWLDNIWGHC
jgi:hypothetical protein